MNPSCSEPPKLESVRFDNQCSFAGIFASERNEPSCSKKESSLPSSSKLPEKCLQNGNGVKEFLKVGPCINIGTDDLTLDDVERVQVDLESLLSHLSTRIRSVRKELGVPVENGHSNGLTCVSRRGCSAEDSLDGIKSKTRKKSGSCSNGVIINTTLNGTVFDTQQPSTSKACFQSSACNGNGSNSTNGDKNLSSVAPADFHDDSSGDVPYEISLSSSLDKTPRPSPSKSDSGIKARRNAEKPGRGKNRFNCKKGKGGKTSARAISPSHFWDIVDEYCRELTYEDMELLEHVMDEHRPLNEEILKIPSLGPHFKGLKAPALNRTPRKRIGTRSHDGWGPLTHRLVSALVEKSLHTFCKQRNGSVNGKTYISEGRSNLYDEKLAATGLTGLDDSGSPKNIVPVDTFVRKVLLDEAEIDKNDEHPIHEEDETDEILSDINQTQCKLKRLQRINYAKLQDLHRVAEREVERANAKQDLDKADKVLIEAYRVISNARAKKKPLSKREKEVAIRALERRKEALKSLYTQGSKDTDSSSDLSSNI